MAGRLVLGADVGGSKAHLVIADVAGPGLERQVTVPTREWYADGYLSGVIAGIAGFATGCERRELASVGVGAHGCDSQQQCRRLQAALEQQIDVPVVVVNDAELVLPAAGVASGCALIAGTGSIAVGYDREGEPVVAGGWGAFLGDEGSGTGLFRDLAKKAVDAYDRGERKDPLGSLLVELLRLQELRDLPARLAEFSSPVAWAPLAPTLIDRALASGSTLAREVIEESAAILARLVGVIGWRGADTTKIVAAGGVVEHSEWMRAALVEAFKSMLPDAEFAFLTVPPVNGAVQLARAVARLAAGELGRPSYTALAHYRSSRAPAAS